MLCLLSGAVIWLCIFCTDAIAATLEARIDKSDQEMTVYREGKLLYRWPVSTARPGKNTPTGVFRPKALKRMHFSTIYDRAPMPFSIFFAGNYAIHGTTQIEKLGCVASAGCVRLHPDNAEILFNMVLEVGMSDTLIIVRD
ncbi:L,D-transpeptidase [Arenibacterium sp. CAU 1754]